MRWAIGLLLATGCDVRTLVFEGATLDGAPVFSEGGTPECDPKTAIAEQCNGLDDDCDCPRDPSGDTNGDGIICARGDENVDEDDPDDPNDDLPNVGIPCGSDVGECSKGTAVCAPSSGCIQRGDCVGCSGNVSTAPELCDGLDNDCDLENDNGYNFCTDVLNCGGCSGIGGGGVDCTTTTLLPSIYHSTFTCNACEVPTPSFVCKVAACDQGWSNFDGLDSNGCEVPCGVERPGPEICDGEDNDCDGAVDAADSSMLPPPICRQAGECAGTVASCVTDARCATCPGQPDPETCWVCEYPPGVEFSPMDVCRPANVELLCDDLDGNCNSLTDESFPLKNSDCNNGGIGACAVQGQWICDPMDVGQTVCSVEGDLGPPPANELCNGQDDNCNDVTDENVDDVGSGTLGVRDSLVHITRGAPALDFYIYQFEASRPGATDVLKGAYDHRACSQSGVLPWGSVTRDEAITACTAAGLRLCTQPEWDAVCYGTVAPNPGDDYPYGEPFDATACNGKDANPTCAVGDDCPVPTGSLATCDSPEGIFDLSGNLKEWTEDPEPDPPAMALGYRPRGGSFDNIAEGMSCDFDFTVLPTNFRHDNLGFRCCCTAGSCP